MVEYPLECYSSLTSSLIFLLSVQDEELTDLTGIDLHFLTLSRQGPTLLRHSTG